MGLLSPAALGLHGNEICVPRGFVRKALVGL